MDKSIKKYMKRGMVVAVSVVMIGHLCFEPIFAKENKKSKVNISQQDKKKISDIKGGLEKDDLNFLNKKMVDNLLKISNKSGRTCAMLLNQIDEESDTYQVAVKEILNLYYENEIDAGKQTQLGEFQQTIASSFVQEKIEDYEEAKAEREAENLDYVPGEVLVCFDNEVEESEIARLADCMAKDYEIILDDDFLIDESLPERKKKRLSALANYKCDTIVKMELNLDQTVGKAVEELEQYEGVESAEENSCIAVCDSVETNDTYCDDLKINMDRVNMGEAWDCHDYWCKSEIWIAVLDTGFRLSHEDLKGRFVNKYTVDVTKENGNGGFKKLSDISKPYDNAHGTWTAGIIGAKANNKKGIYGAASSSLNVCRMIGVKISDGLSANGAPKITSNAVLKGVKHAVNSGAEVISMSISFDQDINGTLKIAADYAEEAGVVFVSSAGNEGNSAKRYPAAYDTVIGVGGMDVEGHKKADFSSYGSWVNIIAPATNFKTTDAKGDSAYISGKNGTSYAVPLVASTAALMLSANSNLTPKQIRSYLNSNSYPVNSSYFQCGLLNAGFALQRAKYEEFKNCHLTLSSVIAESGKKIKISWIENDIYDTKNVQIYRATSKNGTYTKIDSVNGRYTSSYTDTQCKVGVTYYYKVRVRMKYGDGYKYCDFSDIKSAKAMK